MSVSMTWSTRSQSTLTFHSASSVPSGKTIRSLPGSSRTRYVAHGQGHLGVGGPQRARCLHADA
jgi:hypothetical protein